MSSTRSTYSSDDELNVLSLEEELAQCERSHFLDQATEIGIPYPVDNGPPPPIPPRNPMLSSLPLPPPRSTIPLKMVRSAENAPSPIAEQSTSLPAGKKHFLDENPIPPEYEYDPLQRRASHKEQTQQPADSNVAGKIGQFDAIPSDRLKHKRLKEPSYALSRFLETEDGASGSYTVDGAVHLSDVRLSTSSEPSSLPKVGTEVSVLSMFGCLDRPVEMTRRLLELSKSPNTCATLRHSRCIPLMVQMIHCDTDELTKQQACEALRNVVNHHPDDKAGRREAKVLRYIESIMEYCNLLRQSQTHDSLKAAAQDYNNHPLQAMSSLMKISFDEEHRHAMCQLGALQTIASLVHLDHELHGTASTDAKCILLRRYAGMALTNLTFGDGNNKALLCNNRAFMKTLVAQIPTDVDCLLQVTANVLRNLSWRADNNMKSILNEIGTVTALTVAAMRNKNEATLRAILSALWNLSAHCSKNKRELCQVEGALLFLVEMLTYDAPSKTLSIIENAGGILRNVSSHIAVNEEYRKILRQRNCLGILLKQLESESLTIVSNACGTLWNLSARCPEDQKYLYENKAISRLQSLTNSKHKMISDGSRVAMKNIQIYAAGRNELSRPPSDPVVKKLGLEELPTLSARKQRALKNALDEKLPESCDTVETAKPMSHSINQGAPKSFSAIERSLKYVDHDFGQLSLQNSSEKSTFDESTSNGVVRSNSWQMKTFASEDGTPDTPDVEVATVPHSTGTIPKRTVVAAKTETDTSPVSESSRSIESTTTTAKSGSTAKLVDGKAVEPDADQITNFSLLYTENQSEHAKKAFTEDLGDTVKCYDSEGTPHIMLSTATSLTDLRPVGRPGALPQNVQRLSKSGRATTENSGFNTPERPSPYHGTVPSTPGESASKTVKFNEFALETPMMFSRHSSLGSLGPHDVAVTDEIASVVSEFSRQPSGIISPSEIPDSPSQSMPQSPRHKRAAPHAFPRTQSTGSATPAQLTYDGDEVRTFDVENTPAHISCATSISNLSFDDEPKISNDGLVREMRLMHQLSNEPQDGAAPASPAPTAVPAAPPAVNSQPTSSAQPSTMRTSSAVPKVENIAEESSSDSEDSLEDGDIDSQLLESCINTGIQAVARAQSMTVPDVKSPPALPKPTDIIIDDPLSSDDEEPNEELLQQIIQSAISNATVKSTNPVSLPPPKPNAQSALRENPMGMFRKGGASYMGMDEVTSRFHMEDSPRTYSVASGLSGLTIGSQKAELLKDNRLPSNQQPANDANDNRSLSPSSVESNEEDALILEQAIAAGIAQTFTKPMTLPKPANVNASNANATYDSNDSISSMEDECNANALLEQCIQEGMTKSRKPNEPNPQQNVNAQLPPNPTAVAQRRRSQLPTPRASATSASSHQSRPKIRSPYDAGHSAHANDNKSNNRNTHHSHTAAYSRPLNAMADFSRVSSNGYSKNAQTTSANVSRTAGAPDVVQTRPTGTNTHALDPHQRDDTSAHPMKISTKNDPDQNNTAEVDDIHAITASAAHRSTETGCSLDASALDTSTISMKSRNSFGGEIPLLEQSNEFPAHFNQTECLSDSQHSSSVDMDVSNECLFDSTSPLKMDKHKDPNLMLQSVERLTLELVSTAEYLRTANSLDDDDDVTITETKSKTISADTWNDDTNPNAVSFPSISQEAPVIAKCTDLTFSEKNGDSAEVDGLDTDSAVDLKGSKSDADGICFEIGGEISQINYVDAKCYGHESHDTSSALTNSTIIAMEANKIHAQLMQNQGQSDSTLSLDKIRPPSVMDRMVNSGYCDSLTGTASLKNSPARYFPSGMMARRAIQSNGHPGSMDSINSNCTLLDRVKPPSLMDDLLDSMVSLDSIKTEFVDVKTHLPPDEMSHYETALSECDDMTTTLKCCPDLPMDSTPCGSDFSSVESTPKKGRRSLTPRRKRQMTKERYQTYTIPDGEAAIDTEILKRQNSDDSEDIFQMQISNHALLIDDLDNDTISLVSADDHDMSSIRALTRNLTFLNGFNKQDDDASTALNDISINTNTFTKHSRAAMQNGFHSSPMQSGDFYESLPMDETYVSNESYSPNGNASKSPRIVKPTEYAAEGPLASRSPETGSPANEPRAIRGRRKPAYVSPYSMAKLTKVTAPVAPQMIKAPAKVITPKSPPNKAVEGKTPKAEAKTPKIETKTPKIESKAKSFIQRSAESLKRYRPTFTSKLMKTSPKKSEKPDLSRQQSTESGKTEHLIRQNTFTKDEPSEGDVPVIVSEPASPAKSKPLVSRIPFNRTVSLQSSRNVVKCKTNIEIPAQRSSVASITQRILKSASSTSQIVSSPTSVTARTVYSARSSFDSPSTSKSLFKKWSPSLKSTISSPIAATAVKSKISVSREPIASVPAKKGSLKPTLLAKPSKIATGRLISTNGKTTNV